MHYSRSNIPLVICILFGFNMLLSQVGIGTPLPEASAQLDVVADDRGILIPRVALTGRTDTTTIENGNVRSLLVFNTTTTGSLSEGYYYWDSLKWQRLLNSDDISGNSNNIVVGNGMPTNSNPLNPDLGSVYIDTNNGTLYAFSGGSWMKLSNANNGLMNTQDNVTQLGGELLRPTTIETNGNNTLALSGLEDVNPSNSDVLLIHKNTNVIQKTTLSSLLIREEALIIANQGQTQFITPVPVSTTNKLDLYRNGVKLGFSILNENTISLEAGLRCFQGDEIRIVQYH